MKKLIKGLMLLGLIFSASFGIADRVNGEESETLRFSLHKLVFPEKQLPDIIGNDGDERLKEYTGLNGVTFEVYDVTQEFNELLDASENKEATEVQAKLQGMDLSGKKPVDKKVTATIGDKDGIANFNLSRNSNNKDAVYLFRETAAPSDIKSQAADMVVALPLFDENGQPLKGPIHLYPKNELIQQPFEKEIVDPQPSYQYGDSIQYKLTTTLPISLGLYSKYQISDQADDSLLLDAKSIRVQIEGKDYSAYQIETSDHHFKLIFDPAKFKPCSGKKLTVTYRMTLKDKEKVDQEILNQAALETNFSKVTRERRIKTGGKKFIKVDDEKKANKLANAEFLVKNNQSEYLQETVAGYAWNKDKKTAVNVKLVSNKAGSFEIKGLRYGKYFLEEIKAPAGYFLSKKEVPFEISENSYIYSEGILQVVNQKESSSNKRTNKSSPTSMKKQANSGALAQIPKTNDSQNLWLIVIGYCLIVIVYVIAVKKRRSE